MLVDNKFIYINLPRCGSTSFHYSCILNELDIKNFNGEWDRVNSKIDFKNIDESDIMNIIQHGHETLPLLKEKFGSNYPVIAVKRDRHESFYSLYKHAIFDLKRANAINAYEYLKNVDLEELFFYKTEDITTDEKRINLLNDFLLRKNIIKKRCVDFKNLNLFTDEYVLNIMYILITPASYWHNHDKDIIWFDIKELNLMEKWVSDKIGKPFILKKVNSSNHIECNLKLDEAFRLKYNEIYDFYDNPKTIKTLI